MDLLHHRNAPQRSAKNIYYLNSQGETLLNVFQDTSGKQWLTYNKYDPSFRLLETYNPSALSGYAISTDHRTIVPDYTNGGLVNINSYETSALGYLDYTAVAKSISTGGYDSGSMVKQESFTYVAHGDFYNLASDIVYAGTTSSLITETTSYTYSTFSGANQPTFVETHLPTADDDTGGSTDVISTAYDSYGRPIAMKDAAGYITYMEYDPSPTVDSGTG